METQPFHESIIIAINDAVDENALTTLSELVKITEIPENKDEILEAFRSQGEKYGWEDEELEEVLSGDEEEEDEE